MAQFKSFRFFTESAKSRQLWRYIVRTAHRTSPQQREEMLGWARAEFDSHRNESDPEKIRFYVSEGLKRAREMDHMLDYTRQLAPRGTKPQK